MDTNAFLLWATQRFPLRAEVERVLETAELRVPESVLGELRRLVARGTTGASLALEWARSLPVVGSRLRGDPAIEALALRTGAWVVTADRLLAQRLGRRGVPVLVPRDRRHLEARRSSVARPARRGKGYHRAPPRTD